MTTQSIQDFLTVDLTVLAHDREEEGATSQLSGTQLAEFLQLDSELSDLQVIARRMNEIATENPDHPEKLAEFAGQSYTDVMDRIAKLLSEVAAAKASGNPAVNSEEFDHILSNLQSWAGMLAASAGHVAPEVLNQARQLLQMVKDASPEDLSDPGFQDALSSLRNWTNYYGAQLNPDNQDFQELKSLLDEVQGVKDAKAPGSEGLPSFAWVKIYSAVALWALPEAMINNSNAIQAYVYNGLQQLSLAVMQSSQKWSTMWMGVINKDKTRIDDLIKANPKDIDRQINDATISFNAHNTQYQQFLQWFNSMNDALNNTSSNTTQTQTQNNGNIGQGPLALLQVLTNIWSVIA